MEKITLTNAHGTFTTTGLGLDLAMIEHLPNSVNGLRDKMAERLDGMEIDHSDVHSVTAFLVMFADMDYPAAPAVDPSVRAAVGQRQSDMALGIDRTTAEAGHDWHGANAYDCSCPGVSEREAGE